MYKKLYIFLLSFILLFVDDVASQKLNIEHTFGHTSVGFDLNSLYNYNIYEHHRWGAGFDIITPIKYDTRYGSLFQNSIAANAYFAYGTGDEAGKYGGSIELLFPRAVFRSIGIAYQHDLQRIGSHSFNEYNLLNTSDNSTYLSSRYVGMDRIAAKTKIDPSGPSILFIEYIHSRERYLFDATRLLYPSINDNDAMPYSIYNEIFIKLYYGDHWKFSLLTNVTASDDNVFRINSNPLFSLDYVRFLSEYSNTISFTNSLQQLSLFAQCGFILGDAPFSRRFDLSGTGGCFYYFNNTFLTVPPNTFLSDAFVLASIRYTAGISLWKSTISEPHPFLQLSAVWGMINGKNVIDGTGSFYLEGSKPPQQIALTAPNKGLLEPCIGIDKLLRWGVVDLGIATAYQLAPKNSSYHIDNFWDKFAVMLIAKLIIQ